MKHNYEMMKKRMEKGYGMKDLADKVGLCTATVSKIEKNFTRSRLENYQKIASALDSTWDEIVSENK